MRKRILATLVALATLATCVCGCGSTTVTTSTTETETSTEAETETETETITVNVTGYDVDNLELFKGTTLYLECEVNGEIEIHHFNEEWIPNFHLTEVEVVTNGSGDPKDWEVIPPTEVIFVEKG